MAITRTQIAKQLLAQGGRTGFQGGGKDMGDVSSGFADNRDRGKERSRQAAQAIADARVAAGLGDPDPNVDEPVDTITSLAKNLNAARKANPLLTSLSLFNPSFAIPTIAKTAYQTGKARDMLGLTTPIDDDDDDDDRGNGDEQSIVLPPMVAQAPSITEQEPELTELQKLIQDTPKYRFAAEGGIMNNDVVGGEFDFESARQMYGLGKLVKKVTKTVKKISKSPIGKAALAAATIKFGGPLAAKIAPGTFGSAAKSPFLRAIGRGQFFGDTGIFSAGKNILFGTDEGIRSTTGLFDKFPGGGVGAGITALSLLPLLGLGTGEETEEEAQELLRGQGLDIADIRANPNKFLAPRFAAEGGIMRQEYQEGSKEPVAKKTMPLLDMDGKEMDLRDNGGFVPIGRMEKADDVPARLSKNEFVFTADAVRNAGDGSVDKGAEVMYNMMKNLEAGGEVSEESQGLEGARKMFQTSKRLEEVL